MAAKKTCFVISPIGENGSATRKRANQIFNYVVREVLSEDQWSIERADTIPEPGIITNQIIERLVNSDLVIADLSERNPNVFYELAVRHIARKPYVHLISVDEDIPFDNAPVRAIKIDVQDLDSVAEAKRELLLQVERVLQGDHVAESPISVALSLSEARKRGDQDAVLFETLMSEIGGIKRSMHDLAFIADVNRRNFGTSGTLSAVNARLGVEDAVNQNALRDYLRHSARGVNDPPNLKSAISPTRHARAAPKPESK